MQKFLLAFAFLVKLSFDFASCTNISDAPVAVPYEKNTEVISSALLGDPNSAAAQFLMEAKSDSTSSQVAANIRY